MFSFLTRYQVNASLQTLAHDYKWQDRREVSRQASILNKYVPDCIPILVECLLPKREETGDESYKQFDRRISAEYLLVELGVNGVPFLINAILIGRRNLETGIRNPIATVLLRIGLPTLPLIIEFVRKSQGNHHIVKGYDFTQNQIDSVIEILSEIGRPAVCTICELATTPEFHVLMIDILKAMTVHNTEIKVLVGSVISEHMPSWLNTFRRVQTIKLLAKMGSMAVPALVAGYLNEGLFVYSKKLQNNWKNKIVAVLISTDCEFALNSERASVGFVFLEHARHEGVYERLAQAFQKLPLEIKHKSVALFNEKWKESILTNLQSSRIHRMLDDPALQDELQVPNTDYERIERILSASDLGHERGERSYDESRIYAAFRFINKYQGCVYPPEFVSKLEAWFEDASIVARFCNSDGEIHTMTKP